jgi:uncharacterized protein YndB with AHSA1/START domain
MANGAIEPVRCSIEVKLPPERAFKVFVEHFGRWWPIAYTYGEHEFDGATIEPKTGGHWFEKKRDGTRMDWGEVRLFQPGREIVLSFNVGADRKPEPPERNSEVAIRFVPAGGGTRIELEHRQIERHKDGEKLRAGMASGQGWPLILAAYAREARYAR